MTKNRKYNFTRLALDEGSSDSPTNFYADEIMLKNGKYTIVRREIYEIDTFCLINRLVHVKKIDKMLKEKGFTNYAPHFSFRLWVDELDSFLTQEGLPHGSLGEQLCKKRYINNNDKGTRVTIEERSILNWYRVKPLEIVVHGRGDFEDYVETCNLFRKMFGLNERSKEK